MVVSLSRLGKRKNLRDIYSQQTICHQTEDLLYQCRNQVRRGAAECDDAVTDCRLVGLPEQAGKHRLFGSVAGVAIHH